MGMKNHFDISGSIEIREVDIAGVACISFGLVRPRKSIVVTCVSGSLPKTIRIGQSTQIFFLFSESAPKIYGLSGNLKHFFLGLIFRNADFLFTMLGQH